MTPQEELELIDIELELRKRQGGEKEPAPRVTNAASYLPNINGRQIDARVSGPENLMHSLPGAIVDSGLEGAGASGGQALGAATGPFAPAAIPVFGAIGAVLGNAAGQVRRNFTGEQKGFRLGEALGAAPMGAIPGASLAKAPLKAVAKEAAKYAAANIGGAAIEKAVDEKRMLTAEEAAKAGVLAAMAAPVARVIGPAGKPSKFTDTRDSRFANLRQEGWDVKVPPHSMERGPDLVSSLGGKTALESEAALHNAPEIGKKLREEVGMAPGTGSISADDLKLAKAQAGAVYEKVDAIGNAAKEQLAALEKGANSLPGISGTEAFNSANAEKLTQLKALAQADTSAFKQAQDRVRDLEDALKSPDLGTQRESIRLNLRVAKEEVNRIRQGITEAMQLAGQPELAKEFDAARQQYAKLSDIERSWTEATGFTDANVLARMHDADPERLTGNLRKAAQFAGAFRDESRDAALVSPPAVNKMSTNQALQSAGRGTIGGVISAAAGVAGKPVRKALMSDFMQDYMAKPVQAGPSMRAAILKQMLAERGRR